MSHRELEDLRATNGNLGTRLESIGMIGQGHRSLLSEMECEEGAGTTTATSTTNVQGDEITQVIAK